jgi:hypothetical protein
LTLSPPGTRCGHWSSPDGPPDDQPPVVNMDRQDRFAVRICTEVQTRPERCLEKILGFFGIESRVVDPRAMRTIDPHTVVNGSPYSVLVAAAHLAPLCDSSNEFPPLLRSAESVFVFGFDNSQPMRRLLGRLTRRSSDDCAVRPVRGRSLTVTAKRVDMCGVLSGLTVERTATDEAHAFDGVRGCDDYSGLIADEAGDVFFACRHEGVPLLLAVAGPSLDIDEAPRASFFDVRDSFSSVVPLVAFLKREFPTALRAPDILGATLIVDDPSLKRRYGFLDFQRVLAAMHRHDFSTTIAFIPWNWWRTRPHTAALFRSEPERYSLTVHGCDHTAREFGTHSAAILQRKLGLALQRVERHRRKTGLRVSPIMVFPQGVFSAEAAHALQRSSFMAAVNTEVHPSDGDGGPRTEVRELWRPAITKYAGFPIFTRRYIEHGIENVAFDALLGKPCLLVAHHEVFKDGASSLIDFVDRVNAQLHPVWSSLEDVIRRSYLTHRSADGRRHVEMFANEMILQSEQPERVVVTKAAPTAAISRVTCGGQDIPWEHHNGRMRFLVDVSPASAVLVHAIAPPCSLAATSRKSGTTTCVEIRICIITRIG